jgi:hypothetical protein
VPAKDWIAASCSAVSLRARARYRRPEGESQRDRHRGASEGLVRRSGNGIRVRPTTRIEDAEPIPVASALSTLTPNKGRDLSQVASGTTGHARQSEELQFAVSATTSSAVNRSTTGSTCSPHPYDSGGREDWLRTRDWCPSDNTTEGSGASAGGERRCCSCGFGRL